MLDFGFITQSFVTLFSVVDPIATVPIFLSMTLDNTAAERRRYARNASLTAVAVLLFFLAFGQAVFQFFEISLTALRIAGGIILLIISLDLLKATHTGVRVVAAEAEEGMLKHDISITPLGVPMLGGPGAISTVMVVSAHGPKEGTTLNMVLVILLVGATCFLSLRAAEWIRKKFGVTGINVVSRLMGLLLLAMAVQTLMIGFREARPFIFGE